jgi:hypothetical protein
MNQYLPECLAVKVSYIELGFMCDHVIFTLSDQRSYDPLREQQEYHHAIFPAIWRALFIRWNSRETVGSNIRSTCGSGWLIVSSPLPADPTARYRRRS